ncbi:hypothetical protein GOV06_04040 [Candidatus Woesearchaeota archaeon]|nr:hypothetical protein [Candidatus Woesearchaeota archaeon]
MVKIKRINKLRVAIVPKNVDCSELTKENAELYFAAEKYSQPWYDMVVSEFEKTLKKEAGLDRKFKKKREVELEKGDIKFKITGTPGTSTSYQSVCTRLEDYLTDLKDAVDQGIRRTGLRNLEDGTYISLNELQEKMEGFIDDYTNPKITPKIEYSKMRDQSLEKMLEVVEIEPETSGKFTGTNAKKYRLAKEQSKRIKSKVINPFKKALKAETEYSSDNVPEETVLDIYEIGEYAFSVLTVPKETTKYSEVVNNLKATVEKAQEEVENGRAEMPGLRIRDAEGLFEIDYMVDMYEKLIEDNTKTIVEQKIQVMPIAAYDEVISA